jgi:hypothetical protein
VGGEVEDRQRVVRGVRRTLRFCLRCFRRVIQLQGGPSEETCRGRGCCEVGAKQGRARPSSWRASMQHRGTNANVSSRPLLRLHMRVLRVL